MKSLIAYFVSRPLVCNVILIGVLAGAAVAWIKIGKEEMPDFAMDWLRVQIAYPGASAEDVELFITKPVEESLKGVTGLYEISSSSSRGVGSLSITLEPGGNSDKKIQEIKDAVERAELPREAEDPVYRQYNSAEKAIIDIAVFNKEVELLTVEDRIKLQEYVLSLKNQLLTLPEVSGIENNAYLQPELQVRVQPDKLLKYNLSLGEVRNQIEQQHVRTPIGTMTDKEESSITMLSELDNVEALKKVILRSGFEGQRIRLGQVATVQNGFEKTTAIYKVQGREAVIFNIQKSASVDIISAQEAVLGFVSRFQNNHKGSPYQVITMDDESYDVRNRLSLVATNGIAGFLIIVSILFLFLDFRSGLWVAMGIPFTLSFTIIAALLIGYTVNNITLAAIIIVLGIVVDDAIIIAENVARRIEEGESALAAAINGTYEMGTPIIASILTTCVAFVPLYFFTGRFGMFVKFIPVVVGLMLLASFIESIFILPSHLAHPLPLTKKGPGRIAVVRIRVVRRAEFLYQSLLETVLRIRFFVMGAFVFLFGISAYIFTAKMDFVMFPREETRQVSVRVIGPENMGRLEMAQKVVEVENIFLKDDTGVVTSVRTTIAQSRRGGAVKENEAFLRVELLAPSEREVSSFLLLDRWEKAAEQLEGFEEIRFLKDRFGSESGSAIAIEIQENNDEKRLKVAEELKEKLAEISSLTNVEVEKPLEKKEYRLQVDTEEVSRLDIAFDELASTLRGYVQGHILYTINSGDEVVDVRLSSTDDEIDQIKNILNLRASNQSKYLVPVGNLVDVVEGERPTSIQRTNYKRTINVFADLAEGASLTPLEIAEYAEANIFPDLIQQSPSTVFHFRGEVEDSRESQGDFGLSILLVLLLIYILLVFLYNSLTLPLIIGSIVPFGTVGVILAFMAHGMMEYGFFAVIGTLGMAGVVVNNAIIMVSRLEEEKKVSSVIGFSQVAAVCATRLRPVVVTTLTTVAGLFPTAYGLGGYDSMLAEMMLALGWGLIFGTLITLFLVPCIYSFKAKREAHV